MVSKKEGLYLPGACAYKLGSVHNSRVVLFHQGEAEHLGERMAQSPLFGFRIPLNEGYKKLYPTYTTARYTKGKDAEVEGFLNGLGLTKDG
jgi:hypothetical protein